MGLIRSLVPIQRNRHQVKITVKFNTHGDSSTANLQIVSLAVADKSSAVTDGGTGEKTPKESRCKEAIAL